MPGVAMNAVFWRKRAEEWHAVANDTIDPEEKQLLFELVADYDSRRCPLCRPSRQRAHDTV